MRPGKIAAVGWNYRPHLQEARASLPREPIYSSSLRAPSSATASP